MITAAITSSTPSSILPYWRGISVPLFRYIAEDELQQEHDELRLLGQIISNVHRQRPPSSIGSVPNED